MSNEVSVLVGKKAVPNTTQKTPCQKGECLKGGICMPCVPTAPKPQFATPIRDLLWMTKVEMEKQLYQSRVKRYNRLGSLLGQSESTTPLAPLPAEPQE
jgi:hypothetical protein